MKRSNYILGCVLGGVLASMTWGCGQKDETEQAAPPAGPDAHAVPSAAGTKPTAGAAGPGGAGMGQPTAKPAGQ